MFKIKGAAREREPDTYVPFIGHASAGVLLLDDGSLLTMLRLDGAAFELADTGEVNSRHAQLNILLRNIASDRVVVATHVVRTLAEDAIYPDKLCTSTFARELDATYRKQLMSARLFRNELFLSILLRPAGSAGVMDGNFLRLFTRRKRGDRSRIASTANLDLLGTIVASITSDLSAYGVELLGLREAGGVMFSEIAEALRLILTGEHLPVPLVNGHLGGAIYTDRVIVGREAIEIRGVSGSTFAAGFALLEYPARTRPGMFDSILAAPYRCVLTQTYGFLTKQNAQGIMSRKQNQMVSANDKAASQTIALTEAADMLASNEFAMGDHHLTLVTFADNLDRLGDVAGRARRDLAESGAVVAREDLALEAAYWGQLPGNMKLRVRPGVISSRNFAAMSSLHNYPLGVKRGHWGEPLTLFRSTGGTAYRFHLHAPTETVQDVGNVFMAGPSGSGKTTLTLFILAMVERQGAQVVFFDKDRGGEILAHAVGGTYLVLTSGSPTGLAPLKALTSSSTDTKFIAQLVKALVGLEPGKELLPEQERRLALGVQAVMELPKEARSLGELRAFLGQSDPEGTGAKLDKWCKGGALGWVLDNDNDTVALDAPFLGFDVTAFLDDATTRGPILSYLFHRVESLLDGRRLVLAIDEFWKVLLDQGFRDLVNDKLKTIRKLNGLVVLSTQSPADALRSPIAYSIIEQCPTQILMPNARADAKDYREGLKLTAAEYQAVREDLVSGGRRFLLKQGNSSIACELDLSGMDDLVAVLSARTTTRRLMERLIADMGPDPAEWLPHFKREWRRVAA